MDPINVDVVGFYPKDNAKENHTEEYDLLSYAELPTPIYRRGQNFIFAVRFSREFDKNQDVVRISFGFGPRPSVPKGTRVILPILADHTELPEDTNKWGLAFASKEGNTVFLKTHIPPNALVGIWCCSIQTNIRGNRDKRHDYKCEEDIYVLFNPWCNDDAVYMPNEDDRQEYVLNETGKIWCGTYKHPKGKQWIFGQFDEVVLPAAVFLLEKCGLNHADRGSPILVTRAISAVINANDDNGLLVGRWDGSYQDGTAPFAWTGSTAILDEFLQKGGQPVKYGQCWVFSAVTVTICRTLGIPCRSVTNYISAHDTNQSLTIDKYFDKSGELIENGPEGDCFDSCWNFHVWNDVWMTRPDLKPGYGGWQVIDATPQELSGNTFCCGPASVEAVRRGDVGWYYDTAFVFSEVNADICRFQEDEDSTWGFKRLSLVQDHVGRKLVTQQKNQFDDQGINDQWDVTLEYKNPEGSEAERLAVFNAIKGNPKAQHYYEMPKEVDSDVTFDLVEIDTVPFGQNFKVVVRIKNVSNETRNISAMLSASSIFYNGNAAHRIKKAYDTFSVRGGQTEVVKIIVKPEEYMDKLVDHNFIKIYAIANVKETKQTWSDEDDFTFVKPSINIEVDGEATMNQECAIKFSFQNPLNVPLTECYYSIEIPGLQKPKSVAFREVDANEMVTFHDYFVPSRSGEKRIVATFNSKQMQGVSGSANIKVN